MRNSGFKELVIAIFGITAGHTVTHASSYSCSNITHVRVFIVLVT